MSSTGNRKLLIRADASPEIGHGHIMRMLALAQAWQKAGGVAEFVCAAIPDRLEENLRKRGFSVSKLRLADVELIGSELDVQLLAQIANSDGCWSVMLDGYRFDSSYVKSLKAETSAPISIMVDEQPGAELLDAVDLVVYPSLNRPSEGGGELLGQLLEGPDFVLIREEFIEANLTDKSTNRIEVTNDSGSDCFVNLLVCLGGSDPLNVTFKLLDSFRMLANDVLKFLNLRVIVGASNRHVDDLRVKLLQLGTCHRVELLVAVENMPEQLLWADAILSAAGGMVGEWLYMGLQERAAVCAIAENQLGFYGTLVNEYSIAGLGSVEKGAFTLDHQLLAQWVTGLVNGCDSPPSASELAPIVDGGGADRICSRLSRLRKS